MERRARVNSVMKAAGRLKGNQRICFHLHYVEGWDLGRIAKTLPASEGTVKSHLDRARTKVKQDREVLPWKTEVS